ncbi:DUF551 domain-containing protein [Klebsiella quasipneumoniae]
MENKTMIKSTITRERAQQIFLGNGPEPSASEERELARIALAAMDSEPVEQDEREAFETFMAKRFGDLVDQQRAKNGDHGYIAWDMAVAWIVWQASTAMLQAGKSSAHVVDRPVAWHHTAKSKEENHSNCCFSYSPSHDFGPRYEKPHSHPHYLPERLDYDRALHFLSTEPRKVTPETVIGGNSPVIPDGSADMLRRWLAFGRGMQNAGSQLPRNLIAETEAMLAASPHDTPTLNSVQSVVTAPGKWIPVSERMPDDDDFVYIWPRPDFGVELHVGQYCECSPKGDGWYAQVYEQNYGIEWHPITVTHWMPLPNPPKEEK